MARAAKSTTTRTRTTRTGGRTTARGNGRTSTRAATAETGNAAAAAGEDTTTGAARANGAGANGVPDLAGGLQSFLGQIENEVCAVSALSERIDELVSALNAARAEQAERLLALDALRAAVTDDGLGSFLDKAIRPRKTRVAEVVPDRLQ
jgi:hypothetical protein